MNLRILLSVYAVLMALGGLIWLLLPAQHLVLYGVTAPDPLALLLGRFAGTMAIALAVMAWNARRAPRSPARHALVLGITVANTLGAAVCVLSAMSGRLNAFAWGPVGSYVLFSVLFIIAGRAAIMENVTNDPEAQRRPLPPVLA